MKAEDLYERFEYWRKILRLRDSWDVTMDLISDTSFQKTGDFRVDPDDKKAVLLINMNNPNTMNLEEVIVHELLHLKLYPLDQLTEGLIESHYEEGDPSYDLVYTQFMTSLEQTVSELTKCFLLKYGKDKTLSFGRVDKHSSFNELYKDLKPYGTEE